MINSVTENGSILTVSASLQFPAELPNGTVPIAGSNSTREQMESLGLVLVVEMDSSGWFYTIE